jgi:hypothetical protein
MYAGRGGAPFLCYREIRGLCVRQKRLHLPDVSGQTPAGIEKSILLHQGIGSRAALTGILFFIPQIPFFIYHTHLAPAILRQGWCALQGDVAGYT